MGYTYYTTFDTPIPYKGLTLYPVKVKDYMTFQYYSSCLILDKNTIPDAKIIQMSYLQYLFWETEKDPENHPYILFLDRLLALVLKEDESFDNVENSIKRYSFDSNGKPLIKINEILYTSRDFEEIRTIICEQNLLDLPDDKVQKEVKDSLEKAKEYKNKLAGIKSGTLEDYLISLAIATGWTLETVYNLSIRKFIKTTQRLDNLIHYKIYLGASLSGMVEFKDKSVIKHWLANLDSDEKYGDVQVSVDDIEKKINFEKGG